ncbi:MAG: type VI secretion system tip protein VgrG, partial [Desulfobacteraceae bacterium]|nr:type VI secretion system tip protein VgrG [Desulfobacteraceae bacterium]
MKATQQNKLISIETPLGKDVLLLTGFKGTETISRCFEFHLTMISEDHNIAFKDVIGASVTIHIERGNGEVRYINGIVSKFEQGRGGGESGEQPLFSYYTATLVPWLWPLKKTSNSRIFQEKSVVDIVEQKFKDNKMMDFKWKLQSESKYKKRVYCVQYGESDFNFISRLL